MVERLEPASAGRISRNPLSAGSGERRPSRWRWMFSITTMASSAMSPSAAAIPARVMRLMVWPKTPSPSATMLTHAGTATTATSVSRKLRRKMSSTSAARATPIRIASRTPLTESDTYLAWS